MKCVDSFLKVNVYSVSQYILIQKGPDFLITVAFFWLQSQRVWKQTKDPSLLFPHQLAAHILVYTLRLDIILLCGLLYHRDDFQINRFEKLYKVILNESRISTLVLMVRQFTILTTEVTERQWDEIYNTDTRFFSSQNLLLTSPFLFFLHSVISRLFHIDVLKNWAVILC